MPGGGGGGGDSSERMNQRLNFSFRGNRTNNQYRGGLSTETILNTPNNYNRQSRNDGRQVLNKRIAEKPMTASQADKRYQADQKREKAAAVQRNQSKASPDLARWTEENRNPAQDNSDERTQIQQTSDRTTARTSETDDSAMAGGSKSPSLGRRRGAFGGQGALSRRTLLSPRG